MNRRSFLAVLGISTLALTGCAPGADSQAIGESDRVAALGLGDADTLLALGVTPVAVAPFSPKSDLPVNGLEPWAEPAAGGASITPIFNTTQGFTAQILEEVTAVNPTQIIAVNQAVDAEAANALRAIAPTTLKPEGFDDWRIPWKKQVEQISAAVGKEQEGQELIAKTDEAFKSYREAHPDVQGKKAAIVMPYSGKLGLYTSLDGRGQFIESMGLTIPAEVQGDPGSFYVDIAPENYNTLAGLDVIYVLEYQGAAEHLKSDPAFSPLLGKAVCVEQAVGNAMSTPNPLSIPWALEKLR